MSSSVTTQLFLKTMTHTPELVLKLVISFL